MEKSRWWHVAIAGSTALMLLLLAVIDGDPVRRLAAAATMLVFAGGWVVFGRHAWRDRRAALAYACIVVLVALVGTSFVASFAFVQTIAYPLVWTLNERVRTAIWFNVALCSAVAIGFLFSDSRDSGEVIRNGFIQLLSLGFSISFGLWISSIAARSQERQRLLDELRATQLQLESLSRVAGAVAEREHLAREIHDTIAQDLTGLVMLAQRARREKDAAALAEQLETLEENARAALVETRSLVVASAPVDFAHGGLAEALARLAERFTRETGVAVTLQADAGGGPLDRDTEVVLLRCAQESLANVRKHSGAASARIVLEVAAGTATLTVSDDGSGFDASDHREGFGLPGMRERLAIVGGTLEVTSAPGHGATVAVTLPVRAEAAAATGPVPGSVPGPAPAPVAGLAPAKPAVPVPAPTART